jgi:4-amino-4-deoxy-L-arabinose transferase-like glycosyltransferase
MLSSFQFNILIGLGLLGLLIIIAMGIGNLVLRKVVVSNNAPYVDILLLSLPIGLGVAAYGILTLGLIGWLKLPAILLWLLVIIIIGSKRGWLLVKSAWGDFWDFINQKNNIRSGYTAIAIVLMSLIWIYALMMAFTPPWDYDGLMYHLEGPRSFLQTGRIIILPDLWGANGPATGEMLFIFGLSVGSDVFPKLIHWFYGVIFCLATFRLGWRLYNKRTGFIALAILCGIPYLPFLASWAYIDLIWASYEILAYYCLFCWIENPDRNMKWLVISGLLMGFSLGSKYLALSAAATAVLVIVWEGHHLKLKQLLKALILFSIPAVLIASPWYIKNWLLAGNPIYPLLFGGMDWSNERWKLLENYLYSFGTGRSFIDFLLIPWNLYFRHQWFVTFLGSIDFPSFLFPIALLYPFVNKNDRKSRTILFIILLRLIFWSLATQQTRFLYPIFPFICVITAKTLLFLKQRISIKAARILGVSIIGSQLVLSLAYTNIYTFNVLRPWSLWTGAESTISFLRRILPIYETYEIINNDLSLNDKVLFLWDGRGYYCNHVCIVDSEHSIWVRLIEENGLDVERIANALHREGIYYLLLDKESLIFSLIHDNSNKYQSALEFFETQFVPQCTKVKYQSKVSTLYKVNCFSINK